MSDPWMKFYPSDWRSDPKLRLVSMAARGLWMEMLCLMHEADNYGDLCVAGVALDETKLARMVGESVEAVTEWLSELREADVFSTRKNGVIYSRRMEKDENKRRKARENGKKGGNPSLSKQTAIDQSVKGEVKTQKPEARSQKIPSVSKDARKRASRLPENWTLPVDWLGDGFALGLPESFIRDEGERMANWSRGSPNGAKLDWRATWKNWIKREAPKHDAKSSNTDRHRAGFQAALRGVDQHGQPLPQPGNDEPTSPAFRAALGLPH